MIRKSLALALSSTLVLSGCSATTGTTPGNGSANTTPPVTITPTSSASAIKHVVVIFGENVSFDHYFGTYPNAVNTPGEPTFTAAAGTPIPNNYVSNPNLLSQNPNLATGGTINTANGAGAANPFRLARAQAATADQDHGYTDEQSAFHAGKMDLFPASVGTADTAAVATATGASAIAATKGLTMGYYDGNTATALWNYAQHYAMSDHSFGTNFGPSTDGAVNLISGQTNGVINTVNPGSAVVADGNGGLTLISDADPTGDICSSTTQSVSMSGKNVGDMLNASKLTWGWFEGGFDLTVTNPNGTTGCKRSTASTITGTQADYSAHHEPFQYYASTANFTHVRPTSIAAIGTTDAANHQYDTHDFTDALAAGNLPAVSFLKAPRFQDAHAANSDPIDEGTFVATMVNAIQKSSFWPNTAIIIAYDDSDGWYDHLTNLVNGSATTADTINGAGVCISTTAAAAALPGLTGTNPAQGRCGYGPRLPLIVISPWAKKNYIDSTVTDQSSVLKFIEDTFLGSQRIGGGSFDSIAGSLNNMFDFSNGAVPPNPNVVQLNTATGVVTSGN
ncbi:phospholipase C [Granulicella arctica]|uniref:phospholipase C n=1 Tax=Granulicella arctica TaxID=940613 RepID=UPI0021E0BC02|nr:alkaline phosphatase family protein [Granulicella arctica]